MSSSQQWIKVAENIAEIAFQANDLAVVDVSGKKISLGRFNSQIFAFAYQCPHAAAILADGYIDAKGQVVCPMHSYKFSLSTGKNTSGEGYTLRRWPIELREDGLYVAI